MEEEKIQNEKKWSFVGYWTPVEIFCNPYLSLIDKALFGLISNLAKREGGCTASNEHFAKLMDLNKQTISNSIQKLKKYQYIHVQYFQKLYPNRAIYIKDFIYLYQRLVNTFEKTYQSNESNTEYLKQVVDDIINDIRPYNGEQEDLIMGNIKPYNGRYIKDTIKDTIKDSIKSFNCSKEQLTTSDEVAQSNFLNSTVGQKGIKQDKLDKPKKDYPIDIEDYSSDVQNIYEFWNSLGKPLSKHRNGSKTNYNAIKALNKAVKKFPANEIMDAMERYHNMLINGQEYKLNIRAPGNLVGLNEFFRFDDYTIPRIDKNNPAYGIQSWFEECSKNDLYLQRTYGKYKVEDEYPETTKKIKQYWKQYTNTPIPLSPNSEDCFRLASNKFHRFVKKHARNKLLQDELRGKSFADNSEYIYKALEKTINEDWDKIKVHWLCSDNMFDDRLRDYFIAQGMMWEEVSDYGPSWLTADSSNNMGNQSNHQKEQRELYSGYEEYEDEYSDLRRELNQL